MIQQCCAADEIYTGTPTGRVDKVDGLDCNIASPPASAYPKSFIAIPPDVEQVQKPRYQAPQDSTSAQRPRRAVVVLLHVRSLHGAADAGRGRVERAVFNAWEGGGQVGGGGYGAGRWGWKRERRGRHGRSRGWRGRGKGSMGGGIVWALLFYRLLFSQRDARKADPKVPGQKEDDGKASTAQYEHIVPRRSSRNSVFFMPIQSTEGTMATGHEIPVTACGVMRVPEASERIRHGQGCRLDGPVVQLTATPHGD